MKDKKILAFTPIFLPHMGGAERTIDELYKRLVSHFGVHVTLVTPKISNSPNYEVVNGIEVFRISVPKNKPLKIIFCQVKFLLLYFTKLRKRDYRILHVHYGFHLFAVSFFWKRFLKRKLVVSEYHLGTGREISAYNENPLLVNYICGMVYKMADKILTISHDNKRYIEKFSGRQDAIVIKQGTDHKFFTPERFSVEKYNELKGNFDAVFCTTSRISPRKNIEDQILVTHFLREKGINVKLIINGKVDTGFKKYFNYLEEEVEKFGLENHIIFNGFVSDLELAEIYACSDLFLLTSKYEGFGIANTEAMASGTPSITYNTGAAHDFIYNFENGYVVESKNAKDMAQIIIEIIRNSSLLKEMSRKSRQFVENELNWDLYAKKNYHGIFEVA